AGWVGPGGRARVLRGALVTAERYQVGTVLCVQDRAMKQAWCLATSSSDANARALMSLYGKRWSIECGLRDTKDLRFGMGMGSIHGSTPARRDRLWLLTRWPSLCRRCSAPPARLSDTIDISSRTPPSGVLIRCSAKAACSTTSSPPCPRCGCCPWSSGSPQCWQSYRSLPGLSGSYGDEGS